MDSEDLAYPFDYLHNALTEFQKADAFEVRNNGYPAKLSALSARKARTLLQRKNSLFYAVQACLGHATREALVEFASRQPNWAESVAEQLEVTADEALRNLLAGVRKERDRLKRDLKKWPGNKEIEGELVSLKQVLQTAPGAHRILLKLAAPGLVTLHIPDPGHRR